MDSERIPKVNVLLSAYNGEKYIEEQLESIKAQRCPGIRIYVRDDGSTDGTVPILKEYARRGEIVLTEGENLRWGRSFLTLLSLAEEGDYWAFCDQDDVWKPDKVERAVRWMEAQDASRPLLWCGSYEEVSENLSDTLRICDHPEVEINFRMALTNCFYMGFACVINRPLRELMLRGNINEISSHDHWASLLVTKFGTAHWDPRVTALHRRLDESASAMGFGNRVRWFMRTLRSGESDIRSVAAQYCLTFSGEKDEDLRLAEHFAGRRYNLRSVLFKAFYPRRWRGTPGSDLALRLLMIVGKV